MIVKLNTDSKKVDQIRSALKANNGYCPCQVEKSEDTKCICKIFSNQIKRHQPGLCPCGLWNAIEEKE